MWAAWVAWAVVWACGEAAVQKYTWGDALADPDALGPDGHPYPSELVNQLYSEGNFRPLPGMRRGRALHHTLDPEVTRAELLQKYHQANSHTLKPEGRSLSADAVVENMVGMSAAIRTAGSPSEESESKSSAGGSQCLRQEGAPARLCKTRFNTTAPMYGVSLTSGKPVTIVQKFPDLLQQVIFEVCESEDCDVVHGKCVQTYVPYLFLVIPLGPVTLTGQDYVLVEAGCACQPRYSTSASVPSPLDALPGLQ